MTKSNKIVVYMARFRYDCILQWTFKIVWSNVKELEVRKFYTTRHGAEKSARKLFKTMTGSVFGDCGYDWERNLWKYQVNP